MKFLLKLSLLGLLTFSTLPALAQQKFGYINSQEVVYVMPEVNEVKASLEKMDADYAEMLELIQVEYNTKYEEFQKNSSSYTPAVRKTKEEELYTLQTRWQQYYRDGAKELEEKQVELMTPIFEKVNEAIKKVGKANGMLFVLDKSVPATVYIDESNPSMVDITPLVKKELGIKE